MKIINLVVTVFVLALQVSAHGFMTTCNLVGWNVNSTNSGRLQTACKTSPEEKQTVMDKSQAGNEFDEATICSSIDLSLCLGNAQGVIVARNKGGFLSAGECSDCNVDFDAFTINCKCLPHDEESGPDPVAATTRLDAILANNNGTVNCLGMHDSELMACSETERPVNSTRLFGRQAGGGLY